MRALDTRSLNRALLARQFLLQRSKLPLTRVVERMGGVQTQYAPSGYIGLWSRVAGFERPKLTDALEKGRVVQGTLMRVTIHMVSAADYPVLTAAIRRPRRSWWLQVSRARDVDENSMAGAAEIVRQALSNGPLPRADLIEALADQGHPKEVWEGVGLWVDLIRVPPSGTWERRRADLYGLAPRPPRPISESEALEHLARRYLGGYGPGTMGEMSSWAGVPINILRPVVERMSLRVLRTTDGSELLDLPRQPLPDPDTPAPVRFLPTWDATLLTHARRTQILPEEYRAEIFNTKNPHSLNTFLIDGTVAGSWRHRGDQILLEPFAPIPRAHRRDLDAEADRLARFLR